MIESWLIQRASFATNKGEAIGIDSILNFDYMGSAEYEFGALPKSLKRIREKASDFTYMDVPIQGKVITVYCKDALKVHVKVFLEALAKDEVRLKEYSGFPIYITAEKEYKHKTPDFWWDLENDFMFWKKDVEFEAKFKVAIEPK